MPQAKKPNKIDVLTSKISQLQAELKALHSTFRLSWFRFKLSWPIDVTGHPCLCNDITCFTDKNRAKKRPNSYKTTMAATVMKPLGCTGRTSKYGFSLRDEMGLRDNKTKYNKIMVSGPSWTCYLTTYMPFFEETVRAEAGKYLNTTTTLRHQDHCKINKVIAVVSIHLLRIHI